MGALFAFGAFVAQFWAIQVASEGDIFNRAFDAANEDIRYKEFQRLGKRILELSEEIGKLEADEVGKLSPFGELARILTIASGV